MILPNEVRGAENKRIRGVGAGWKGTAMERFWRKVELDPATGCLVWTGALSTSGYGMFVVDGCQVGPHRWLWEQFEGPVPAGLEMDHLCRNRACVNLLHLEPVTGSENQLRGINPALTRARKEAVSHCPYGHPYDEANTYREIAKGYRHCRACHRERMRTSRAARAVA